MHYEQLIMQVKVKFITYFISYFWGSGVRLALRHLWLLEGDSECLMVNHNKNKRQA